MESKFNQIKEGNRTERKKKCIDINLLCIFMSTEKKNPKSYHAR